MFDDKGRLINRTLGDYKIATALDVPELEAVIIETNEHNRRYMETKVEKLDHVLTDAELPARFRPRATLGA